MNEPKFYLKAKKFYDNRDKYANEEHKFLYNLDKKRKEREDRNYLEGVPLKYWKEGVFIGSGKTFKNDVKSWKERGVSAFGEGRKFNLRLLNR